MKSKSIAAALQHALDGILQAYRTQRHIRFHFYLIVPVLLLARFFEFDRQRMVILFLIISLVLVCEMFNTALEAAVDLFTEEYHPQAKRCKDIAAGAVLIASLNAMVVGSFLFFDEKAIKNQIETLSRDVADNNQVKDLLLVVTTTVAILLLLVFIWKVRGKKGTPLHGGVVSGHSALAFFFASTVTFTSSSWTAGTLAFFLALLVSQSRIEGEIHTLWETVWGAVLGIMVTLLVFAVLPRLMESFVR